MKQDVTVHRVGHQPFSIEAGPRRKKTIRVLPYSAFLLTRSPHVDAAVLFVRPPKPLDSVAEDAVPSSDASKFPQPSHLTEWPDPAVSSPFLETLHVSLRVPFRISFRVLVRVSFLALVLEMPVRATVPPPPPRLSLTLAASVFLWDGEELSSLSFLDMHRATALASCRSRSSSCVCWASASCISCKDSWQRTRRVDKRVGPSIN